MISENARIRILTLQVRWKQPTMGQIWSQIEKSIFSKSGMCLGGFLWPLFVAGPSITSVRRASLQVTKGNGNSTRHMRHSTASAFIKARHAPSLTRAISPEFGNCAMPHTAEFELATSAICVCHGPLCMMRIPPPATPLTALATHYASRLCAYSSTPTADLGISDRRIMSGPGWRLGLPGGFCLLFAVAYLAPL